MDHRADLLTRPRFLLITSPHSQTPISYSQSPSTDGWFLDYLAESSRTANILLESDQAPLDLSDLDFRLFIATLGADENTIFKPEETLEWPFVAYLSTTRDGRHDGSGQWVKAKGSLTHATIRLLGQMAPSQIGPYGNSARYDVS